MTLSQLQASWPAALLFKPIWVTLGCWPLPCLCFGWLPHGRGALNESHLERPEAIEHTDKHNSDIWLLPPELGVSGILFFLFLLGGRGSFFFGGGGTMWYLGRLQPKGSQSLSGGVTCACRTPCRLGQCSAEGANFLEASMNGAWPDPKEFFGKRPMVVGTGHMLPFLLTALG